MSFAERVSAHDLAARKDAREKRPRPWMENSVLVRKEQQRVGIGRPAIPLSATQRLDTSDECNGTSPVIGTCSPEQPSTGLSFTSPLPVDPTITRVDEFLKDIPGFDFLTRFLEPPRAVDIPAIQKFGLANYLRQTVEATCFDWFRRWMPEQVDWILLDGPDQLDVPGWTLLLEQHHYQAPDEAFGISKRDVNSWDFSSNALTRHIAVHRTDFDTARIRAAVRLALVLKDVQRAEAIQHVVKTLYGSLAAGEVPVCNFINIPPSVPLLRPELGVFRMMYSMMDLLCQKLFDFIKVQSPSTFENQIIQQIQFADLETWAQSNHRWLFPGEKGQDFCDALVRLRRELRNCVEHRNLIDAKEAESMMKTAVQVMATVGDCGAGWQIIQIWRHCSSATSNSAPHQYSSRPIAFLKTVKHLDCWKILSCPGAFRGWSRELIVRKHHPYLYCWKGPILENLALKTRREEDKHTDTEERYNPHLDAGLAQRYGLTAKWYQRISAGKIDVDEARSPAVDYWDGKLEDAPDIDLPVLHGWPGEPQAALAATVVPEDKTPCNKENACLSSNFREEGRLPGRAVVRYLRTYEPDTSVFAANIL